MAPLITNPTEIRQRAGALASRVESIRRALASAASLPETRARAKADLMVLSQEAITLWSAI